MKSVFTLSFSLALVFLLLFGCVNHSKKEDKLSTSPIVKYEVTASENGYGYKIYVDSILYINQPNVPALSGTAGFENESEARKIAELAASKIRQGIMPPTISKKELIAKGIRITNPDAPDGK